MDGRTNIYLFLILIIVVFVHAGIKTESPKKIRDVNIKKPLNRPGRRGSPGNLEETKPTLEKADGNGAGVGSNEDQNNADDHNAEADAPNDDFDHATETVDHRRRDVKNPGKEKTRPVAVGDTFTTSEMLEIAKRLLAKVTLKNKGKGIISSAKNIYELADRLFEGFFATLKRIVLIRDIDISGLDALQALSLNGDVVDTLRTSESFTEPPLYRGFKTKTAESLYQTGADGDLPTKCHYKVIKKLVTNQTMKDTRRRKESKGLKLEKRLGKNRNLIVNPSRKGILKPYVNKHFERSAKKMANQIKTPPELTKKNSVPRSTIEQPSDKGQLVCRWKYACKSMLNLETCRLHKICKTEINGKAIEEGVEEDSNLKKFRRMVGLDILDEEVEKILESHYLLSRTQKQSGDKNIGSIGEYFYKIMRASGAMTTEMSYDDVVTEGYNAKQEKAKSNPKDNAETKENNEQVDNESAVERPEQEPSEDENEQARRILGLIPTESYKVTMPKTIN